MFESNFCVQGHLCTGFHKKPLEFWTKTCGPVTMFGHVVPHVPWPFSHSLCSFHLILSICLDTLVSMAILGVNPPISDTPQYHIVGDISHEISPMSWSLVVTNGSLKPQWFNHEFWWWNSETSIKSQLNPHFNPKLWLKSLIYIVMHSSILMNSHEIPHFQRCLEPWLKQTARTLMQWPLNFLQLGVKM